MAKSLSKDKQKYLKDVYFDTKSPISFSGLQKVWASIRKDGIVTKAELRRWLQSQDTYTSFHPYKRKFRRPKVIVAKVDDVWGTDVAYMVAYEKSNDGYAFFAVFIDIASRYAWAYPLKSLKGAEMTATLKKLFSESGVKPERLFSDQGSEYKNKWVAQYLHKEEVSQYYSLNEKKVGHAERLIKDIKLKLVKYMSENNIFEWVSVLDDFINHHNNTRSRAISMTPAQARTADPYELWVNRYYKKHKQARKPGKPKNKRLYKFKVGDRVKLLAEKKPFDRAYNPRFTTEVFTVIDRKVQDSIPMYSVKDELNESIVGRFYEAELTPVIYSPDDKVYKIEKVLKKKKQGKKTLWYVRWQNYDKRYDSWIPALSDK